MPLELKKSLSEFQTIINIIFNNYSYFAAVYLDDMLLFSNSINEHMQHMNEFYEITKDNGLVLS